jgi:amino acid transporter
MKMTETQTTAKSELTKADRFYQNPVLRDEEWNRAKQPPWWLMASAIAIIAVAFFVGVYGSRPYSIIGGIVGVVTILIYIALGSTRRRQARQQLRKAHEQADR